MSGIEYFKGNDTIKKYISATRATITAPFFGNNVTEIKTLKEAYLLAKDTLGVVELKGRKVKDAEKLGLPPDANQLLFNDGAVVGRCAAARKIIGDANCDINALLPILREAMYKTRNKKMLKAQTVVGLDKDFMIKANLLIPEEFAHILYGWMSNFQVITDEYAKMYQNSTKIDANDIYIVSDPDWSHPDHPYGLTLFDPEHNCAAILGMRYFGEHKKGTLTLAWGCASQNGYAACHGGIKKYTNKETGKSYQAAFFGLSGSGKSTITHAKHLEDYNVTILHDDAFITDIKDKYSIALEPAYFDSTRDYPIGCKDNDYIIIHQNAGVIEGEDGIMYAITGDIRNGNGRAIKSRYWSKNRVDRFDEPLNAIFWLMKDSTMPPVVKVKGSALSSAMGATLATKRTVAERLAKGVDLNALVIEPYANPFRVYPLSRDYERFKQLFDSGVECYILNTGTFLEQDITPKVTLGIIEKIVKGQAEFKKWGEFDNLFTMDVEGFNTDLSDKTYSDHFKRHWVDRMEFIKTRETEKSGVDKLPQEALAALALELAH
jgi:phosphoenolpyruvate carboxykinase (ATP)